MGIRGLTTIVNDIPSVWTQEERLCDTEVIIDGNTLMYFLYDPADCRAGGEYKKFSSAIKDFFDNLKHQRVIPYVVLDGANVAVPIKRETVIKRTEAKIDMCHRISMGKSNEMVLPPLAKKAFLQTLRSLGIELRDNCHGCDADKEIARLAKQRECPVISRDSDFFIYDLPQGYIPLDNLKNGKECPKRFYREKLSHHLGIPSSFLPLLASLLGNDFVQDDALASFNQALGIQQSDPWHVKTKIEKISSVFYKKPNIEEALQSVLDILPKADDKVRLEKALSKSMAQYDIFGSDDSGVDSVDDASDILKCVIDNHAKGYLPSRYMGVILSKRNTIVLQVEDTRQKSVSNCSEKLRKVMYGIILKPGEKVTEWKRKDHTLCLQERIVEPDKDYLESYNLKGLKAQDEEQRRRLLLSILDSKKVELPKDKELFVMSIRYWIAHAEPRVTERHVQTLILQHLQQRTSVEPISSFDLSLQHSMAQWQSVVSEIMCLNKILLNPFPEPDVSTLYSGATSQGIMYEMLQGKALDQFISQLADQHEYQMIYKAVTDGLDQKLLDPNPAEGDHIKPKRKDKRQTSQKQAYSCGSNRFAILQELPGDV